MHNAINIITAAPLTVRGMEWDRWLGPYAAWQVFAPAKPALPPSMVVGAASELTWTPCFYLPGQRVSGDGFQCMSRIV